MAFLGRFTRYVRCMGRGQTYTSSLALSPLATPAMPLGLRLIGGEVRKLGSSLILHSADERRVFEQAYCALLVPYKGDVHVVPMGDAGCSWPLSRALGPYERKVCTCDVSYPSGLPCLAMTAAIGLASHYSPLASYQATASTPSVRRVEWRSSVSTQGLIQAVTAHIDGAFICAYAPASNGESVPRVLPLKRDPHALCLDELLASDAASCVDALPLARSDLEFGRKVNLKLRDSTQVHAQLASEPALTWALTCGSGTSWLGAAGTFSLKVYSTFPNLLLQSWQLQRLESTGRVLECLSCDASTCDHARLASALSRF